MRRLRGPLVAVLAVSACGCLQFFPEASLPVDEPTDNAAERVSTALGIEFKRPVARVALGGEEFAAVEKKSPDRTPSLGGGALDQRCLVALASDDASAPPGAAARPSRGGRFVWDHRSDRIVERADRPAGNEPFDTRVAEITRIEALGAALASQHVAVDSGKEEVSDAGEAALCLILGAAHVAALEASLSPIAGFDPSAAPIRRMHARLTADLLADPAGAPARLLAEKDLPDAERVALERLVELSGADRWRSILRVFAGARFVLEAKDRLNGSQLGAVFDDPPLSTEQILHPERYFDNDDPPSSITGRGRDGLIGGELLLESTGSAGESGLYAMLRGVLAPDEAADAAAGWAGDRLTTYRDSKGGPTSFAWRIDFDDRWEAMEAEDAFEIALRARFGGSFLEASDGLRQLEGGSRSAAMQRQELAFAVVIGGVPEQERSAVTRLLQEVAEPVGIRKSGGRQDLVFRAFRYLASPFLFDCRGRFDTDVRSLYGVLFDHRVFPSGAEHALFNPTEFPYLSRILPEEARGVFFQVERGQSRNDFGLLASLVRSFRDDDAKRSRFWSPAWSRTVTPESSAWGVFYGLLFERAEGAGRNAMSARALFTNESALDGGERTFGVLFDAVNWTSRPGVATRFALLPYGLLADVRSMQRPDATDVGFLLDQIRFRSSHVVPDASRFDFTLLSGWLMRVMSDSAAGESEVSVGNGLLFGVESQPERSSGGVFRVFGRSFLGWSKDPGGSHFDALWMRW